MEIYLQYNICEDFDHQLSLIQSTMVSINSVTSRSLGFTLFNLSRLNIIGMLQYTRISTTIMSSECEILLNIALNLDVGVTTINSFKRGQYLRYMRRILQVGVVCIFFVNFFSVFKVMKYINGSPDFVEKGGFEQMLTLYLSEF